jgi:hypothetical protein
VTTNLSDDLRHALEQGVGPVRLVDAATNEHYVIMRADQYERAKALFEEDESHPRAVYPFVEQSFGKAGWDQPEMDVYNDYDAHRPKR